jgi:hypothetical protein
MVITRSDLDPILAGTELSADVEHQRARPHERRYAHDPKPARDERLGNEQQPWVADDDHAEYADRDADEDDGADDVDVAPTHNADQAFDRWERWR